MAFTKAQPFPYEIGALTNISPLTYRDGHTYLEILEKLRRWLNETLVPDFNAGIDNAIDEFQKGIANAEARVVESEEMHKKLIADAITYINTNVADLTKYVDVSVEGMETYVVNAIQYINNKTGAQEIVRITVDAPYTVEIDPLWPNNHPVHFVLTQDAVGGHAVSLAPYIQNFPVISDAPNSVSEFTLIPNGNHVGDTPGNWHVVQHDERPYIDVRAYGVSSSNVGSVNVARFNLAGAVAESLGKDLYFGPSTETYFIDAPIWARNNTRFYGGATIKSDAPEQIIAAIGEPRGAYTENIVIEGLRFVGGIVPSDLTGPRRNRVDTPSFSSAIRFTGHQSPRNPAVTRRIRNVTIRNCRFEHILSLPTLCDGIMGHSRVEGNDYFDTMDPGFVACDTVSFTNNKTQYGADNGVSVSRLVGRAIIADNHFQDCAYYGIFCAGWVHPTAEGGVSSPGPEGFTITGNVIINSGRGAITLSDAPRYGVVTGNVIDGVAKGPLDETSEFGGGVGITINGYPSSPYNGNAPQRYAEQIIISNNVVRNAKTGALNIRGARDIKISDNMFIDPGTPFLIDGVTTIAATDQALNNFIYSGQPGTVSNLSIIDNEFLDTRAVPISNYPIIPELINLAKPVIVGNIVRRSRQTLTQYPRADRFVIGDGRYDLAQSSPDGGFLLEERDPVTGLRQRVVMQAEAGTGNTRMNHYTSFIEGLSVSDGKGVAIGTNAGTVFGSPNSKMAFFGRAAVATPVLSYSRAAEDASTREIRLALMALGLVQNQTTD